MIADWKLTVVYQNLLKNVYNYCTNSSYALFFLNYDFKGKVCENKGMEHGTTRGHEQGTSIGYK